jgi:hypothetical protein
MKRKTFTIFIAMLAMLTLYGAASAQEDSGRPLRTSLTGAAEVPGPGDPNGRGTASIRLNQGQGQVCYDITVANIGTPTLAHIHRGSATESGPPVVTLTTNGTLKGCVNDVSEELIKEIRQDPAAFYVNVHNAEFPNGAVRGQLGKGGSTAKKQ